MAPEESRNVRNKLITITLAVIFMIKMVTICYTNFKNNPPCQFLQDKIFKKKLGETFIEQIIKFELRGPPGRTRNPKTGYLYDKTKISGANLPVNCYLLLKILQKAMCHASLHLDQVNYKIYPKKC